MTIEELIGGTVIRNSDDFPNIIQKGDDYLFRLLSIMEESNCNLATAAVFINFVESDACGENPREYMLAAMVYIANGLGLEVTRRSDDVTIEDVLLSNKVLESTPEG